MVAPIPKPCTMAYNSDARTLLVTLLHLVEDQWTIRMDIVTVTFVCRWKQHDPQPGWQLLGDACLFLYAFVCRGDRMWITGVYCIISIQREYKL